MTSGHGAPAHLYRVERRGHPHADWEVVAVVTDCVRATRLALGGETGQRRLVIYSLVEVGGALTMPTGTEPPPVAAEPWTCPTCGDSACALEEGHAMHDRCDYCGAAIPPTAGVPLCAAHMASFREGGRVAAEAGRYAREVGS